MHLTGRPRYRLVRLKHVQGGLWMKIDLSVSYKASLHVSHVEMFAQSSGPVETLRSWGLHQLGKKKIAGDFYPVRRGQALASQRLAQSERCLSLRPPACMVPEDPEPTAWDTRIEIDNYPWGQLWQV
jgi:hypothetical protein